MRNDLASCYYVSYIKKQFELDCNKSEYYHLCTKDQCGNGSGEVFDFKVYVFYSRPMFDVNATLLLNSCFVVDC